MRYNIRKNWLGTFNFMITKPIVIMPFVFIAFLEILALEFLFFSTRPPLGYIANPIIRKFFGEALIHYPGNLIILPQLFYYKQIAIYIIFGALLTAISINIFKNIKGGLPLRPNALVKNALSNYVAFFGYAILISVLVYLLKNLDMFVLSKIARLMSRFFPAPAYSVFSVCVVVFLFVTNLIMQAFLICTIPLIVMEKISLVKALLKSACIGFKNFFTIIALIFLPFFIYLPVIFMKSFSAQIMEKTIPEMNLYISFLGIVAAIFVDCFSLLCVSQFLLDKKK